MKMTMTAVVGLALLIAFPAVAQDQATCKAFFQVVQAESKSPGLRVGMASGDKRWWESEGQKMYPGLCLDGSVMSGDKPRYLLIWSKAKSIGQGDVPANEVFGQTASVLQATAPQEWIYKPRWNVMSITVAYVLYDGRLDVPPVHFASNDRAAFVFPDNRKGLKDAVKFLSQEAVFSPKVR